MIREAILLLLTVCLLSGAVAGTVSSDETRHSESVVGGDEVLVQEFRSIEGVEHRATLNTSSDTLFVESHNPTNETKEYAGYVVQVYGWRHGEVSQSLSPNETKRQEYALNDTLSITRTTHSVSVHGWGENRSANFTFDKEIGTESPERYPVPRIVDTEIVDSASRNRTGVFLAVTIRNKGNQTYSTYLYAHTNETQGERAPGFVPSDQEERTVYLKLNEDPSDHVQGEVRLYYGSVTNDTGIEQQVYFEGTLDGNTTFQEEPFEPITPPYEDGAYEYGTDRAGGDDAGVSVAGRLLPATGYALLVVVGLSGVILLFFRLR